MDNNLEDDAATPLLEEPEDTATDLPMSTTTAGRGESRAQQSIVKGVFFLLGIGILAPWNAFISAKDYFDTRLCDKRTTGGDVENTFGLVYNLAGVISLLTLVGIQAWRGEHTKNQQGRRRTGDAVVEETRLPSGSLENDPLNRTSTTDGSRESSSSSSCTKTSFWLVMIPLFIYCSAFFAQVVLVVLPSVSTGFFSLTLGSLAITAMAGSVAQVGIVETATKFHGAIAMTPYLSVSSAVHRPAVLVHIFSR